MKYICKIFIVLILIPAISCSWQTGSEVSFKGIPLKDLVSMVAVFSDTTDQGITYIAKLVLVDFNDPSNYTIVTDENYMPDNPKFSHDKTKILFGDRNSGWKDAGGPQFGVYDIESQAIELLNRNKGQNSPALGIRYVWDRDNNGFFHSNEGAWGPSSLLYHDLATGTRSTILPRERLTGDNYPAVLTDSDGLIIFSNDSTNTNQPEGFFFTDRNGNYISRIDNPHLLNKRPGNTSREAITLDWNEKTGLIVYAEHFTVGELNNNRTTSVTNLDGSFYKKLTSGNETDLYPVWGPGGKTVLFERKPHYSQNPGLEESRIMILNVETGEVREFVSPGTIGGAIGLRFPDY